ncbi:MAG: DUF4445 domain-containing protein [Actinobacteria bacterium]|nr:MAG: DUF4445 domain-containing protein [Actinomycetota bacterium]
MRRGRARGRLPARPRRVGSALDRRLPREAGGGSHVSAEPSVELPEPHPDRVRLRFLQRAEDRTLRETRVLAGTTIFDAASWNGIAIDSTCGGHGTCKKCKVRVVSGHAPVTPVDPRAFSIEELNAGWRLACRALAHDDLTVEVPPLQTRPKAALAGVGRHVILRPAVQKRYLELEEPTLEDQASDLERVLAAMDDVELRVPLDLLRGLGGTLRESDWKVTAVLCPFGADVISRISATMLDPAALELLRARAHETLSSLMHEVCEEGGVEPAAVYEVVVTGNVTMIQLALGIDPEPLSMAPFTITARRLPEATAAEFGIDVHPRAPAVLFPALGAYVGPDIVAGIVATGLTLDRRVRLFIDVGTNSELVLGSSARTVACAAPAGPAFEAAQIRCGMRAADGAIEGVKIVDGEVELTVIGDVTPAGLCGSGLVDAVAELVAAGLLDHSGRFVLEASERFGKIGEENVFHLTDDVFLSQRDVRELQFAKASIATGWAILCRELGIAPEEISQVLLGGSFGSYLTPASAVNIGLVPKLPLPRIISAGNVAGEGAKIVALSVTERAAANAILDEVEYIELSGRMDFNDLFIDQLAFPA